MGKLLLIGLYMTAACFKADVATYQTCLKGDTPLMCEAPEEFKGAGLYLGVPNISVPEGWKKECYEIRASYVGKDKEMRFSIDEWNKRTTKAFVALTPIRPMVTNKVNEAKEAPVVDVENVEKAVQTKGDAPKKDK